ncbi:MAG: hypothetical protein FWB85_08185 [Chitinispirillia bacterium]|nr:hypothetical protein [Chitinispirillia bacterium]
MTDNMLYVGVNDLAVSGRDVANDFNAAIGVAGVLASSGTLSYMPYDLLFTCWFGENGVNLMEGTVRVSLDMAPFHTTAGTFGQLPSVAAGYTLAKDKTGELFHKIFVNFGITFINRSSSAAVLGSYGLRGGGGDEKGAAFFYSSFDREPPATAQDKNLFASLSHSDAGDGKVLFSLKAAGAPVSSWVLRIENQRGVSVNTFSGGNVVPSSVLWDGLRADGAAVGEEMISVKLVLKGAARVVESNIVEIPLK